MTQSGFVSLIILSKSDARYFFGGLTPAPARFGLMKFSAVSGRLGLVSQRATSSLPCGKVLVIAVRYMRERDPTPTFTYLRRGAAAWTMPDMPTAAAPATLRTERRSNVKSLISIPPDAGFSERYIKFAQVHSTSRIGAALPHTPPRCTHCVHGSPPSR